MALSLHHLTFLTSTSADKATKLRHLPATRPTGIRAVACGGGGRALVEQGVVRPVLAEEVASALEGPGCFLLDVRPAWEWDKARVVGSLHVPLFVEDTDMGSITLLKKWVHFGYIGLWTGQRFTTINPDFVADVRRVVPDQEANLVVACGEGLRSLMAVKRLHDGGYSNLGWLAGGFNRTGDKHFPGRVEGTAKLQYATIEERVLSAQVWQLQILVGCSSELRSRNCSKVLDASQNEFQHPLMVLQTSDYPQKEIGRIHRVA